MIKSPTPFTTLWKRTAQAATLAIALTAFPTAHALVVSEGEIYGNGAELSEASPLPEFAFVNNTVMIDQGSGVYLGNGWVLTSTHVGCSSVTFTDGMSFTPDTTSWKVLESHNGNESDIALFRISDWESSEYLAQLPKIRISQESPRKGERVMLAATGYTQSGERKAITVNGEKVGTHGVYLQQKRAYLSGCSTISKIQSELVKTDGDLETASFTTRFGRDQGEAQATAGDSGGAVYRFNEVTNEWEAIGIIFAVSHRAKFVPHNAKTFVGSLAAYQDQLSPLTNGETTLVSATTNVPHVEG